jgi:ADP-heptose:LPS heptosyltransferase
LQHFLIIQTAFIGDVILATSLLEAIYIQYPKAKIDFLVRAGNESLLENDTRINELIIWEKRKNKYKNLISLIKKIRSKNYNCVINLQRFGAMGLLTAFSNATEKVGFAKNPFSLFFTRALPHQIGNGQHEIDRNFSLISHFSSLKKAPNPKIHLTEIDIKAVAEYAKAPYLVMAPASVWFTKQLPQKKWVQLCEKFNKAYKIYLIGAPSDFELCQSIKVSVEPNATIINLCGKLSLKASAALMEKAEMCFVNDSAPLHLASAVNAKTTAFFCNTTPKFGFGPLSPNSKIIQAEPTPPCKPCGITGKKACPKQHFDCGNLIPIEKINIE